MAKLKLNRKNKILNQYKSHTIYKLQICDFFSPTQTYAKQKNNNRVM